MESQGSSNMNHTCLPSKSATGTFNIVKMTGHIKSSPNQQIVSKKFPKKGEKIPFFGLNPGKNEF